MKTKLTAQYLERLKPKALPYYVSDEQAVGLRVRIATSGAMHWNVAYRIKGEAKPKSVSIGACDPTGKEGRTLAEARSRAAEIMKAAREGRDLIKEEAESKAADKEAMTVERLIDVYFKSTKSAVRKGGPLRTSSDIERRLKRALEPHLSKQADNLRRSDISYLLDELSEKHPREAEKRRQTIGAMYRWGVSKGYVATDPSAGTATYGRGTPRERTLSADEIRAIWTWLDEGAGKMPPDCIEVLRLQICLGARVGEIAGMTAGELNEQDGKLLWTLPPERSKNKRARVTPLLGTSSALVEKALVKRESGPLFRTLMTNRALTSSDVGQALNQRPLPCEDFNTHDLRRTVVKMMDEAGIPLDTIAMIIGHQRGTKDTRTLVRHYAQSLPIERLESALRQWDRRLEEILKPGAGGATLLQFQAAQ